MVYVRANTDRLVRYSGDTVTLPNAVWLVAVDLMNKDGPDAKEGSYSVRFSSDWFPQEAIVDAGRTKIPLQQTGVENFQKKKLLRVKTGG